MVCVGTEIQREDAKSLGSEICERKVFVVLNESFKYSFR